MHLVPATPTPLSDDEAAAAIRRWPETDRNSGPLLMALHRIETGSKPIQHNPGNLTAGPKYTGKAWRPPWFEVGPDSPERLKALNARMRAGEAPSAFRAYDNWDAGFNDWIAALRRDFPEVLRAAAAGEASGFVSALSKRYSRDYNSRHVATVRGLAERYDRFFADLPRRQPAPGRSDGGLMFVALLFAALKGLA